MSYNSQQAEQIKKRYAKESFTGCNLSCVSNLDFLDIRQGDHLLDLGCGKGMETLQAAETAGIHGMVWGLDITEEMIEAANINKEQSGIDNVSFIQGNIEDLPFDSGIFDKVLSNCVINHAKDKNKVYEEIFRVLKTGGSFVISDAVTKLPLPPHIKNDPEAVAQCFGGAVTEAEYMDSIKASGFGKLEILKRREYLKNGYDFISLTIRAFKL